MIEIRSCAGMDELDACVALEVETWGYDATEIVPRKMFLLAQKIGGQVIGAFHGKEPGSKFGNRREPTKSDPSGEVELIGFAMSLPGIRKMAGQPAPYLHSHMLAVKEDYHNHGIGFRLKREQRREALGRGIRHMEWTFDPLQMKNAYLNIHKLGAVAREYRENFYGESSSRLQSGLPTDRLIAVWELDSARVEARLNGKLFSEAEEQAEDRIEEWILVPASIESWKASDKDRERALAVQTENRRKFQQAFSQGLTVLGFSRDANGNGVYELGVCARDRDRTAKANL